MGLQVSDFAQPFEVFSFVRSAFQIKTQLPRRQLAQGQRARWLTQQRQRPQQHRRIGQQAHHPSQAQAVEEELTQTQLVFLVGLCGLNPRPRPQNNGGPFRKKTDGFKSL